MSLVLNAAGVEFSFAITFQSRNRLSYVFKTQDWSQCPQKNPTPLCFAGSLNFIKCENIILLRN